MFLDRAVIAAMAKWDDGDMCLASRTALQTSISP